MNNIEQLDKINNDIRDAEWNRDTKDLKTILAEDILFRRASGALVDRTSYLTALLDNNNTFSELENISITTTVNEKEDKAISVVIVKAAGKRGPEQKTFSGDFKNIRFFRKGKDWELYAWYNEVITDHVDVFNEKVEEVKKDNKDEEFYGQNW